MRFVLPIIVFSTGASVMILELAGARTVAPYLGTSIIVWTSIIGVFLAALSLGYFFGGRIADRFPYPKTLAFVLFVASIFVSLCSYFEPFLRIAATFSDLRIGALYAITILFAPATVCLGMVSPLAVKLSLHTTETAGRTVGNLYAISNTGSILGTFLGGFVLISYLGTHAVILSLSLVLLALALIVTFSFRAPPPLALILISTTLGASALFAPQHVMLAQGQTLVADIDTQYGRHWIFNTCIEERPVRILTNILGGYQGMVYKDDVYTPAAKYLQFFDVFSHFRPHAQHALMIGGSAYAYPRHFLADDSERTMTVVEIDPGVTQIARDYFGLADDARLSIVHEDGRVFLNRTDKEYDAIFLDAFRDDLSIPFHLATREAVERMRAALTDDGVLLTNIVSDLSGTSNEFLRALYATHKDVFPHTLLYRIDARRKESDIQNFVLVSSSEPLLETSSIAEKFPHANIVEERALMPAPKILTDAFAPVERYFLGW